VLEFRFKQTDFDHHPASFRYEERNDGYDGISFTLDGVADGADEEPEIKGLPQCIAIPLRQINSRTGRPFPFLSMADITMCNVSRTLDLLQYLTHK